MRNLRWIILLMLVFALACGKRSDVGELSPVADKPAAMSPAAEYEADEAKAVADDGEGSGGRNETPAIANRKLIRNGEVQVRVKDIVATRTQLEEMVKKAGGFIADVRFNRLTELHYLEMTLRLPAGDFDGFVAALDKLGAVENEQFTVEDVTDQWVDLGRRIETKEKMAARLQELIASKSYQFRDLLEVERELSRLRLEIERLQGSLNGMNDKIAFSTLKITLRQEVLQKIVPPDSTFAPLLNAVENFWPRLQASVRAMVTILAFFLNLLVYLLPWAVAGGALLLALYWLLGRKKAKK
ncbi:MAG TPA: DUF4349 domain-containing protein [bacterium]|nr:DUF4349 domain-containing protein [bacterium]